MARSKQTAEVPGLPAVPCARWRAAWISSGIAGRSWSCAICSPGIGRFKDFTGSPEGIPTNILSERLARLREQGVIAQVTPSDGSKHLAYRLTAKGEALRPILGAMRDWGLRWEPGTRALVETDRS